MNDKTGCISAESENVKTGEQMISLYEIDDDYIEYLRKFDNRVLSPKAGERKFTRKYVGVLFHNKDH